MRLEGIESGYCATRSTFDVNVYRTDVRQFIVISERPDNPGASITNCAEFAAPQIAALLGIPWERAVFIECYPAEPTLERYDPTFDRIRVKGPLECVPGFSGRSQVPRLALDQPGWQPLGRGLAEALQQAGCQMSGLLGEQVVLHGAKTPVRIVGYDGRRYYSEKGREFLAGDIDRLCAAAPVYCAKPRP